MFRAGKLAAEPMCALAYGPDVLGAGPGRRCAGVAAEVDHIVPLAVIARAREAEGGELSWSDVLDWDGTQSVCRVCHAHKTAVESGTLRASAGSNVITRRGGGFGS